MKRRKSKIERGYKVQRQLEEKVDLVGPEGCVPQALGRLHRLGEGYGGGGLQRRIRWMERPSTLVRWMKGRAISMSKGTRH